MLFSEFYNIENCNISPIIRKDIRRYKIKLDKKLIDYIRYLRLELRVNEHWELDPIQIRVLNEILFCAEKDKKVKIGDILEKREIASQATIHAALKKLHSKQLITHYLSNETRAKYLELTPLGLKRFKELAKAQ